MFIIRFAIYFTLSFGILSIPLGDNKYLFNSIHTFISPYADNVLSSTKEKLNKTAYYTKKLYSNSEPQLHSDKVKSKMAGVKKSNTDIEIGFTEEIYDDYEEFEYQSDEEIRLRNILKEEH